MHALIIDTDKAPFSAPMCFHPWGLFWKNTDLTGRGPQGGRSGRTWQPRAAGVYGQAGAAPVGSVGRPPRSHGAQWIAVYRTPGSRIEITLSIRFLKRNSDCHPIYDTLSTSCITDQGLGRLYLEGNRRAGQTRRRSVEYGTQSGDDAETSGGHEGPGRCGSRDGS